MKFDDLDDKMRVYEKALDLCMLPNVYMVARIDGRSFTRLTKTVHQFEAPFDERFRDYMTGTVEHLMNCGFDIIYGYTQSDEISLLFSINEKTFGRKLRKYNSVLAGEASAKFSLLLGDLGAFDCRISQLPSNQLVVDYFRWRAQDALRNSLNAYCYWTLRKDGKTGRQASKVIENMSISKKNDLLFDYGLNFNDFPLWQKNGVGFYWETYEKEGFNPKTNEKILVSRRRLKVDYDLPFRDEYSDFILKFIELDG